MITEGSTGSMEVIGIVSWGRGETEISDLNTKSISNHSRVFRLCEKISTGNLHARRELSRLDQQKAEERMSVPASSRSTHQLSREDYEPK